MRLKWECLDQWYDAVAACTMLHDAEGYSSHSPSMPPMLCRCAAPTPLCVDSGWALVMMGDYTCVAPPCFNPYGTEESCPARDESWRPSLTAQVSQEGRVPFVQREGTTAEILRWLRRTLVCIAVSECPETVREYATTLLWDHDLATDQETVKALGEEIVRRANEQQPWRRV